MNKASIVLVVLATLLLAAPLSPFGSSKSNNPCSACHGSRNQYLDILEGDAGNTVPTVINESQTLKVAVVIAVTGNTGSNNVMSSINATLSSQNGLFSVDAATYNIGSRTNGQNATAYWNITPVSGGNDTMVITARGRNTHNNVNFNDTYAPAPLIFVNMTPVDLPPSIVMSAPLPGLSYTGGSNISVNWTVTDENRPGCLVNLYYTTDNFTSVNQTIATGLPANQNHTWKTPAIDSNSVRIKATVTDPSGKFNQTLLGGVFTIDSTTPSVLSASPADKEANVSTSASIQVTFSEPVARSSAQSAFGISPDPGGLSFSWNAQNTTMTVSHNTLAGSTNYTCSISAGVNDISIPGNTYPGTFQWSFGTASVVVPVPSIALSSPTGGERFYWGDQATARWTASGGTGALGINLSISENGTAGPYMSIASGISNSGQYSFTVPQLVSDSSVVRATVFDTRGMQSQSLGGTFGIARPLSLSAGLPPAGAMIRTGNATSINWTATGGHGTVLVNLSFQQDSGSQPQVIHSSQPSTGSVQWNAPAIDTTSARIIVNATDDWGAGAGASSGQFTIFTNRNPRFVSVPPAAVEVGSQYIYAAAAVDDDGDALSFSLVSGPAGMAIDSATGRVVWTPDQAGNFSVSIKASDGHGGEARQDFTVQAVPKGVEVRPSISIGHPSEGQRVSGSVTVSGTAARGTRDIVGIQLRIDGGQWMDASGISAWQLTVDTTGLSDGNHTIEARAFDGTDYSDSAFRSIVVDKLQSGPRPMVEFITPSEGQRLGGNFTVTGAAEKGARNITLVQLRIDSGQWKDASGQLGWLFTLDTSALSNGNHLLEARAFDGTEYSDIASRNIVVDNPVAFVRPSVDFITPSEGQAVWGNFTVTGIAVKGTLNITAVQLRMDSGPWMDVSGRTGWQYTLDFGPVANGRHVLEARAFDGGFYSEPATRTVVVENPVVIVRPRVDFTTPYEGQTVAGNITLAGVVVKGTNDVVNVQLRIDYRLWLNVSGNPGWQYLLDTGRLTKGNHTLEIRAFDGTYYSDTVVRTIDVDNPRPRRSNTVPMLDGLVIIGLFAAVGAILHLRRK